MLEKLKNNKLLKVLGNIIYAFALILVILILILILIQRISNNNVALAGIRIYSVVTGSMIPKYEIGDIIVSKEINPEDIQVGDDVTYSTDIESNSALITHSVVNIREEDGKYYFTTRGIANNVDDPEISEDQVLGRVVYKPVVLSFINKIIRNVYAFYFLIIVPMAIIIAKMIVNFVIRKQEEKEEREIIEQEKDDNKKNLNKQNIEQEENKVEENAEKALNIENDKEIIAEEEVKKKEELNSKNETLEAEKEIKQQEDNEKEISKKEETKTEENVKKNKVSILSIIKRKVKPIHIIILICLMVFNTFAWFMYATEVASSMQAHVTSWNIEFAAGSGEIITNIEIDLDRIYPGMETYEENINVINKGESKATLDYEFQSISILGDNYEVSENMTSDDLENILKEQYPFKINIVKDDSNLVGSTGEGFFRITVEWPFESGNDELDTFWGNKAYEYYSLNPGEKSLQVKIKLIAIQGGGN